MRRERLRKARINRGLSQEVISGLLGVAQKTYSQWETGETTPHPLNIGELCNFFGVSDPEELDLVRLPGPQMAPINVVDFGITSIPEDIMKYLSRREAMTVLLGTAGSLLAAPIDSIVGMAGEVLPFCHANLEKCWSLSTGKATEMITAKQAITSYLPALAELTKQSTMHREDAASMAAQCYRLRSMLSYHLDNLALAKQDAEQALLFASATEDADLRVGVQVHAALVDYYLKRPVDALNHLRQCKPWISKTSHAWLCVYYRTQAAVQAQVDQAGLARRSLDSAYRHYTLATATAEQPAVYASSQGFEMILWEGITRFHLGDDTAIDILESVDPLNAKLPERVRTGFIDNLVFAELRSSRRDLERLCSRWSVAKQRATELQSQLRLDEVRQGYDGLLIAFPGEQRVRQLA